MIKKKSKLYANKYCLNTQTFSNFVIIMMILKQKKKKLYTDNYLNMQLCVISKHVTH